jgi:penicillin-binding protein 1A
MIFRHLGRLLLSAVFTVTIILLVLSLVLYAKIEPQLPSIESLKDVQLQVPLRIYTSDRKLMAEFGEKRRTPVRIEDVPPDLIQAFLAAEDDRFFEHPGVDFQGLLRAGVELLRTGQKRQGGSTITMQVARNFFLSTEKTYLRKLNEILLAFRIEHSLSKQEILELYLNKIYLGHRAYGVAAAAQVYYGIDIDQLSVAQMAMIAALPKAPSRVNPINDPEAALARRNYILGRMYGLGYIDADVYNKALLEADVSTLHTVQVDVKAPYLAEMVRDEMVQRYGEDAYTSGFEVVTTVESSLQDSANRALRDTLLDYSRRHGYRGAEAHVDLSGVAVDARPEVLVGYPAWGDVEAALVTSVADRSAEATLRNGSTITLEWDGLSWARPYKSVNVMGKTPDKAADVLAVGDVIRIETYKDGKWRLSQLPQVQGALVSLRPDDGAIVALVGGFDFSLSKFNRATQAMRQPGSSFKPIIYSAALEKGFTTASIINDAPVVFDDSALESTWRPENYSGKFYGPTRLREALYLSRNLVSVRVLQAIGASYAADYAQRFGFESSQLPHDLTLALGSASVTPLQMARAYAVFANGGYLVEPYFIRRIQDAQGQAIYTARPRVVCPDCPRRIEGVSNEAEAEIDLAEEVITPQNDWLMNSMLQDVIQRGTGRRAAALGRADLAGKTGTTNDQKDAWFCGYNPSLVTTTWVGFDKLDPLGRVETGGHAALPMWMQYMGEALAGSAIVKREQPDGLVTVRIDPKTGLLARSGQSDAIFETFRVAEVPQVGVENRAAGSGARSTGGSVEQLF